MDDFEDLSHFAFDPLALFFREAVAVPRSGEPRLIGHAIFAVRVGDVLKARAAASSGFSSNRLTRVSTDNPEILWKRKNRTSAVKGYGDLDSVSSLGIIKSRSSGAATSSRGVVSVSMMSAMRLSMGVSMSWRSRKSSSSMFEPRFAQILIKLWSVVSAFPSPNSGLKSDLRRVRNEPELAPNLASL